MGEDFAIRLRDLTMELPTYGRVKRPSWNGLASMKAGVGGRLNFAEGRATVTALDDVSVEIAQRERVGLIGLNGAGKSTMLRVMAGIYHPTKGSAESRGRVSTLFSESLGLKPEATGIENIMLSGVSLGLTHGRVKEMIPEIVEVTELGEYVHMADADLLDGNAGATGVRGRDVDQAGHTADRRDNRRGGHAVPGEGEGAAGRLHEVGEHAGGRVAVGAGYQGVLRPGDTPRARPRADVGRRRGGAGGAPGEARESSEGGPVVTHQHSTEEGGPAGDVSQLQDKIEDLERRAELDRLALARVRRSLDARAGEVRVLRHRLQATRSSASFVAGSALVQAAKQPHTLWKLPFQLLRLYRSRSRPAADGRESTDRYRDLPAGLALDPSEFVSHPPLQIPEARLEGPTVAAILDTFTEYSLRYEMDLLLLSRENWRAEMEKARPAFLLVESAFSGNNREWRHLIVDYETLIDNPLRELLHYSRSAGIPTVFWNKEDPAHFDNFIGGAREFDFVFTSDADCVPVYREALGHDRVYVLPFAAQPRIHNPSQEEGWPEYPVCFAGSWVEYRYPDRAEALRCLLDPAVPLGLHVFDRNLIRRDLGPHYRFPEQYSKAIQGTLSYEEMLTAYRCYDVLLNVNTVTDSPTMFARRVFESLACGTPVVSSESVAMSRMLGHHVRVARSREDTERHLLELLGDDEARVREGHLAYRYVHENHTYRHRMGEVFRRVGLEPPASHQPSVSVLMPTMRPENVARCLDNFKKQTYPDKELVLILNNAEFDLDSIRKDADLIPNVQVLHVEGRTTLGDCLNRGVEAASGNYVAKMDDDDHYGERYLSDAVLAASFSDAEVVGKGSFFMYFEESDTTALAEVTREHTFTSFVTGGTLLMRTEVARGNPFDSVSLREDTNFLHAAAQAGCRIYSADRFNFVRVRTRQLLSHADQTPDAGFVKRCRNRTPGLDLDRVCV